MQNKLTNKQMNEYTLNPTPRTAEREIRETGEGGPPTLVLVAVTRESGRGDTDPECGVAGSRLLHVHLQRRPRCTPRPAPLLTHAP